MTIAHWFLQFMRLSGVYGTGATNHPATRNRARGGTFFRTAAPRRHIDIAGRCTATGGILFFLLTASSIASWNISFDGDARAGWNNTEHHSAELHAAGISIRKSFADRRGDRLLLSGLFEAYHNVEERMVHELYARYKGPMGKWNVTIGRIGIPYGLLTSFSTSRLLFESPVEKLLGFDADNGIMVSGVVGRFDYGVSVTQGLGAHRTPMFPGEGFGAGRVGITLGDAEEVICGLSVSGGNTLTDHMQTIPSKRLTGGADATIRIGRTLFRTELNAGRLDERRFFSGFGLFDVTLHHRLDIITGIRLLSEQAPVANSAFFGFAVKPPWFTIRGGYTYGFTDSPHHTVALQLYRLFAVAF